MGLAPWRSGSCWSRCGGMSTAFEKGLMVADIKVVLVTWEICDIISGTMAMATSYEPRTWHSVLFFLVCHLRDC